MRGHKLAGHRVTDLWIEYFWVPGVFETGNKPKVALFVVSALAGL